MAERPVVAAGAVVWRHRASRDLEVCIIHRPHRQDWTLPKGKQEDGEHILATAVREIAEETGHHVALGRPLQAQRYQVDGRPKVVHYWAAEADRLPADREPDDEVDDVRFLPASEAAARLTYPHDQQLVRSIAAQPLRTRPLIVLRHADSLERTDWTENDDDRPLNDRGRDQAKALVKPLNAFGIKRAVSSPAIRCVDTLRPWAEQSLATVRFDERLTENSVPDGEVGGVLRDLTHEPTVICTHRPVLPGLLGAIGHAPDSVTPPWADPPLAKGEFLVIHRDAETVVATERHAAEREPRSV